MLMHPINKKLQEKPSIGEMKDPNGKALFIEMIDVVKAKGKGYVACTWPQPGSEQAVPKVSYVKGYAPWGWIVGSGIYLDDVNCIFTQQMMVQGGVILAVLLVTVAISFFIARSISRPLAKTTANMMRLAGGDKTILVEGTENKAEMGALARALSVFKDNALEVDRLAQEDRAREEKRQSMLALGDNFESSVQSVVNQASIMANASELAFSNVQSIAAATEELSASITEISQQVAQSTVIASHAVTEAKQTDQTINGLLGAASDLSHQADVMRSEISRFLERIRAG